MTAARRPQTRRRLDGTDAGALVALAGPRAAERARRRRSTFGWRAMLKIKHVPEQLFDVTAFPIMFMLMFTYLFGGALAGSTERLPAVPAARHPGAGGRHDHDVHAASTLNTDIAKGVFDRFRSLPIWRPAPIVGGALGDAGALHARLGLVIALGLDHGLPRRRRRARRARRGRPAARLRLRLSWVWTMLGLILRTPNSVMSISILILFPLTFVSNIFVDPRTMPLGLHAFVDVNPITHLATATRGLMQGTATAAQLLWVLAAAAALTALFAPLTTRLYRNRG